MLKKFSFLIILFPLICLCNTVLSDIIPIKKPPQTAEQTQKKLLIDVVKPLPKPINKIIKKVTETKSVEKKEEKIGFIRPKKKPVIAGSDKPKNIKIAVKYCMKINAPAILIENKYAVHKEKSITENTGMAT